ncbi:MAG TPA: accessory Sec system translocase SecA2, partial [Corynebacterium sp.]|nr:accessory Sec system translocase SecA2 [Corynebacterium sp.]
MAFNWFWKAMGASQTRNQKRSRAIVKDAGARQAELTQLDDSALAQRARDLATGGSISDPAEFLAVLGVAAERTLGLTPFAVQSQA